MIIKFKNGSEIQSIDESKDSKRGYIRGRRLTDEEYQRMIYCEQVTAEEKLDEILKIFGSEIDLKYCFPWQNWR